MTSYTIADIFHDLLLGAYAAMLWVWWGLKQVAWFAPAVLIDLFVWDGFAKVAAAIACVVILLVHFGHQYRDGTRPPA